MISEHADKQNRQKRKELEGLGYKFSIGHDGWDVWFGDDHVSAGLPAGKGEQKTRHSLDAAIGEAVKHCRQSAIITKAAIMPEEIKPVTAIAKKQVAAAINLLIAAGAQYHVVLGDDEQTNMKAPRAKRVNYQSFYHPPLEPFKGAGPFTTTLTIPADLEIDPCTKVIGAYLYNHYGKGNYTTETDKATRTMTILVENAPFTED